MIIHKVVNLKYEINYMLQCMGTAEPSTNHRYVNLRRKSCLNKVQCSTLIIIFLNFFFC